MGALLRHHAPASGRVLRRIADVHAFGTTGISQFDDAYIENVKELDTYREAVESGELPVADRDNPRGSSWLSYAAWVGITGGIAARVVTEPLATPSGGTSIWDGLLLGSALLQCLGGLAFVVNIWPRIQ